MNKILMLAAAAAVALNAGSAMAGTVNTAFSVSVWTLDTGYNGLLATSSQPLPATPDATFTYTGALDWAVGGTMTSPNTFGQFLNTADVSGFTSGKYASVADFGKATMSTSGTGTDYLGTYFRITWTSPMSNTSGIITHDDGASLYKGTQTLVSDPNWTSQMNSYFTVPVSGSLVNTYTVDYVEANGAPSVLNVNVPEPASLPLLGAGLALLGLAFRRRLSTSA